MSTLDFGGPVRIVTGVDSWPHVTERETSDEEAPPGVPHSRELTCQGFPACVPSCPDRMDGDEGGPSGGDQGTAEDSTPPSGGSYGVSCRVAAHSAGSRPSAPSAYRTLHRKIARSARSKSSQGIALRTTRPGTCRSEQATRSSISFLSMTVAGHLPPDVRYSSPTVRYTPPREYVIEPTAPASAGRTEPESAPLEPGHRKGDGRGRIPFGSTRPGNSISRAPAESPEPATCTASALLAPATQSPEVSARRRPKNGHPQPSTVPLHIFTRTKKIDRDAPNEANQEGLTGKN